MRVLSILALLCAACSSGGDAPAPSVVLLSPAVDTLRTAGPSEANVRIAYRSTRRVTLYAERDGLRERIGEGDAGEREIAWDVRGVAAGIYTIIAEINGATDTAEGKVTVAVEHARMIASSTGDTASGMATFPDGSYAVAGIMTESVPYSRRVIGSIDFGDGVEHRPGNGQGYVACYEWDGTLRWVRRTDGPGLDHLAMFHSVAPMPDGGVVVLGWHRGQVRLDDVVVPLASGTIAHLLARYGPDGRVMWARSIAGMGNLGARLTTDATGRITMADAASATVTLDGMTEPPIGARDIVVAQFDPEGNARWLRRFGSNQDELVYGLAAGPDGSLALCGTQTGPFLFDDQYMAGTGAYVAKLDVDGRVAWARSLTGTDAFDVAVRADGSVFVGGDGFAALLDPDGVEAWTRMFAGRVRGVCAHPDAGATVAVVDNGALRLVWLDADGVERATRIDETDMEEFDANVASLPDGSIAVASSGRDGWASDGRVARWGR